MIGTLEKEDLLKALGEDVDKIIKKDPEPKIDLNELARAISHNAQVAQQITNQLATEITMTNLVVRNLMVKLGIDPKEIVTLANEEMSRLSEAPVEEDTGEQSDHPAEATIFGREH